MLNDAVLTERNEMGEIIRSSYVSRTEYKISSYYTLQVFTFNVNIFFLWESPVCVNRSFEKKTDFIKETAARKGTY